MILILIYILTILSYFMRGIFAVSTVIFTILSYVGFGFVLSDHLTHLFSLTLIFYNVEFPILNGNLDFAYLVNKFITENIKYFEEHISVILQIRNADDTYYTVGDRFPIKLNNEKELTDYIDYLGNKWAVLDNNKYHPEEALSVLINYTNIDPDDYLLTLNKIRLNSYKSDLDFTKDVPLNLPLNVNYSTWGVTSEWISSNISKVTDLTVDSNTKLNRFIEVTFLDSINRKVKVFSNISGLAIVTFTDKVINQLKDEFNRQVGNISYHIKNNKLFFIFEKLYPKEFITALKPHKKFNLNLMTLDIETFLDKNNKMFIYCISFFDGEKSKSFYLSDYFNINYLIKDLLSTILSKKYSNKTIYIHNSSDFDLIFLMKHIVSYGSTKVNPVIKDGKFINLEVKFGPYYNLNFRDSILLLNSSLANLSKQFNVESFKDLFPYSFVKAGNLNYIGPVPAYSYFDSNKVSLSEYTDYAQRFIGGNWSLKAETIKYCELDCKSLYEVIMIFANRIFKTFSVNISLTPTLASLAFRIFRTHFIPKNMQIPAITGKIFEDLNKAFYGGHVDMYIPKNPEDVKIYHYDINSLYPYVMKIFKYPTNIFAHFKGNISNMKEYNKIFKANLSFLKVIVTAPNDIKNPILPHKINSSSVYGEGTWTGWYYSEELENARKYGYTFEILEGYLFESNDIFAAYVDKLYKMKQESNKDSPNYIISKLLMNSLYGRFGMKRSMVNHEIVKHQNVNEFIAKIGFDNFINKVDIGNKTIISYRAQYQRTPKINMSVSAAITANSRIVMSQFKNNPDYQLFYSDTDSIFIDKTLSPELVDNKKLGLMKLEHVLTKFIALGPKVYGGIDDNGIEFTKTKGLKTSLSLNELEVLLKIDNSLNLNQEKWFNNLVDGSITIKNSPYNLKPTSFKRNLIYENGILVGTNNKIISNE